MNQSRLPALAGALALGVIGAIIYFVATAGSAQPPPATTPPAPHPTSTPTATAGPGPSTPVVEEPDPPLQGEQDTPPHIWTGTYTPAQTWGPILGPPAPELDADQQAVVDPACTFIAALHTFDADQDGDYVAFLDRLEGVTDPDFLAQIRDAAAYDGPSDDFRLWVHEHSRVSVRCAGAPVTGEPRPATTLAGHRVQAWPIETRTQLRLEPAEANPEVHVIAHLVHVAKVPGTEGFVVIAVTADSGHGTQVDPTDLDVHH